MRKKRWRRRKQAPEPPRVNRVRFTSRRTPVRAYIAVALAIAAAAMIIWLLVLAERADGLGGMEFGYLGAAGLLLAAAGLFEGILACRTENAFYRIPILSVVLNSILLLSYILIYGFGLALGQFNI